MECSPSLTKLVDADSVEWLATDVMEHAAAKNLKYLHCANSSEIDSTLLSGLVQLKEAHLLKSFVKLFQQKQRYGRTDLKIFVFGFLLNGLDGPAIDFFDNLNSLIAHLFKNPSRLADEIPLWTVPSYTALDGFAPDPAINVLSRFTDLNAMEANSRIPSQDVQRFLDLLKNVPNIVNLQFSFDQPQDLFDRLPEHSTVQCLRIDRPVSDFCFLLRFEHLIVLHYWNQINAEVVRKSFEELQFLYHFSFKHLDKLVEIEKLKRLVKRRRLSPI